MAGVDCDDVVNLIVVESHEQLGPQGTVVDEAGAEEKGAQELEHHVVQLHVAANHVHQLLYHFALTSCLWGQKDSCNLIFLQC